MKFTSGYVLGATTTIAVGSAFVGGIVFALWGQGKLDEQIDNAKKSAITGLFNRKKD